MFYHLIQIKVNVLPSMSFLILKFSPRLKDNQNSDLIKEINKKTRLEKEQLAQTISRLQVQ